MVQLPLHFEKGLLFVELNAQRWLFDTGTPKSFGFPSVLAIAERTLAVSPILTKPGKPLITAAKVAQQLGTPCSGVLGMDVIGQFDWALNAPKKYCKVTTEAIRLSEKTISLGEADTPLTVDTIIREHPYKLMLHTGFHLSYLEHPVTESFASTGKGRDFHYHFMGGWFQADTFRVHTHIGTGQAAENIRCGRLPASLRQDLLPAGCDGFLGAEFFGLYYLGFSPRRRHLVHLTSGD